MHDTPHPNEQGSDQPREANEPHEPREGSRGFFDWIRSLGVARGSDRWLAGVAGGLAARTGIDPIIVRGIFIVFAVLGGPGLLLYAAGWVLLPNAQGRIHAEDIVRGRAEPWVITVGVVVAVALFLPLVFGVGTAPFGGFWSWDLWGAPPWIPTVVAVLWWVLIACGITWFCIWLSTQQRNTQQHTTQQPTTQQHTTQNSDEQSTEWGEDFSQRATQWGEDFSEKATRWGEDFSEKATNWGHRVSESSAEWGARVERLNRARTLGPGYVILTLAFALIAGGVLAIWSYSTGAIASGAFGTRQLTWILGLLGAVGVLGVSMIIAGARGKYSGWVGFFAMIGVIVLLFSSIIPAGSTFRPFSSHEFTLETDPAGVSMIAGSSRLDLSSLDSASPGTAGTHTTSSNGREDDPGVWVLAGNSTVLLPEDRPTVLSIGLLAGNIVVTDESGVDHQLNGLLPRRTLHVNMDGASAEEAVHVDVYIALGNVKVQTPRAAELDEKWEESR